MAGQGVPRVAFGMPVRNGGRYVEAAVADLLAQTEPDVEVVVCDNASTDGTPDRLERLAAGDARLSVHRNPVDIGIAGNLNRLLALTQAPLFAWAAADDRHAPTFAERTIATLEAHPDAVGATVATRRIGAAGEDLGRVEGEPDLSSPDLVDRLRHLVFADQRQHGGHEFFGLWRRKALEAVAPMGAYAHADRVHLVRLVLQGPLVRVDEELFFNREHPERSTRQPAIRAYGGRSWAVSALGGGPLPPDSVWDPSKHGRVVWPEWRQLAQYLQAVEQAPLTAGHRRQCRQVLGAFAVHQVPKLTRDVLIGAEFAARRAADRRPAPSSAD